MKSKVVSMLLLCTVLLSDFRSEQVAIGSKNASAIVYLANTFAHRDVDDKCAVASVRVIKSGTGDKDLDCTANVRCKLLQSLVRTDITSYENSAITVLQLRGGYA